MKLSIITINWNNREGLEKTLRSVADQTCQDFEYIVVDGGSTDGSAELLSNPEFRISKWVSEKDSGIYNAMNKGIRMASGEYLLFLNSGDLLHDTGVAAHVLPLLSGEDLITGKMLFSGQDRYAQAQAPLTLLSLYQGFLSHPATFIRRQLLLDTPYDESLRIVSDWKFFLQAIVLQGCSYRIIDLPISEFDTNGISCSNRELRQQERDRVLRELFPGRILEDYFRFTQGGGYQDTDYDRLFVKLRDYTAGKYIYSLDVLLLRIGARFKQSLQWVRSFPKRIH